MQRVSKQPLAILLVLAILVTCLTSLFPVQAEGETEACLLYTSIPAPLYEVSKVEGASKWEEFWYITFPMLRHVVVLVIIYTMIDLFTSVDNAVMSQAYTLMNTSQVYDRSSAMMWLYFVLAGLFMGGVMLLYNRFCLKRWD